MLSPRWVALHALTVLMASAFLVLGWWQLKRGESGNLRSYAYALEWPLFALFVVFMWWQIIRDRDRPPTAEDVAPERPDPVPETGGEPTLPRVLARLDRSGPDPAPEEEPDERLAAYNRYLADLHARDDQRAR